LFWAGVGASRPDGSGASLGLVVVAVETKGGVLRGILLLLPLAASLSQPAIVVVGAGPAPPMPCYCCWLGMQPDVVFLAMNVARHMPRFFYFMKNNGLFFRLG
jgi:hypothetical protein